MRHAPLVALSCLFALTPLSSANETERTDAASPPTQAVAAPITEALEPRISATQPATLAFAIGMLMLLRRRRLRAVPTRPREAVRLPQPRPAIASVPRERQVAYLREGTLTRGEVRRVA